MDVGAWGVVVALAIGIGSIWVSVWSAKHNSRTAREERVRERRTDAYLSILQNAERTSLAWWNWVHNMSNWGEIETGLTIPRSEIEVSDSDLATAEALLAAFGDPALRDAHSCWLETIERLRAERGYLNAETLLDERTGDPDADRAYKLWQEQLAALATLEIIVREGVS